MDNLISAVRLLGPRDNSEEARMNREMFDSFRVIKRGTTDSHEPEYEADYIDFHTHDYYEFVLLHGGQCRFLVGDTFHDLKPRTLLMFDGNMIHKAYPYGDINSYERSLLHFRKDWLKPLLNGLEIEGLLDTFEINKNGFAMQLGMKEEAGVENFIAQIDAIWCNYSKELTDLEDVQLRLLTTQFLIYLNQLEMPHTHEGTENRQLSEKEQLVEKISTYLFANYQEEITIEDIAYEIGLTRSYMSHLFKEITGYTIMNYLMSYRLSQARRLLVQEPKQSIKHIANSCGFMSEAHFSRFFKQKIGMTPSHYRKNNQLEDE